MKPAALALSLILTAFPSWSQSQTDTSLVTGAVFVPPVYYVGDLVELRLSLLLPEGKTLLPPLSLPTAPWVLIRDVQVRHEPPFERVTIKFVPFATGIKTLPPLVLGDVTLDGVKVSTNSLLGKEPPELTPPRDQMLLPHTELFLLFCLVVILILPWIVWRLIKPAARWTTALRKRSSRRREWRRWTKEIRKLRTSALSLEGPAFYTQLSQLARAYLGSRFDEDFGTLTAAEAQEMLQPLPPAWRSEWVRLLRRSDVVRFDAQNPSDAEKLDDLDALQREAGRLEGKEAVVADV
jgi:hypothetical protein